MILMNRCSSLDEIQMILIHFLHYFVALVHVLINRDAIVAHIAVDGAIGVVDNMDD